MTAISGMTGFGRAEGTHGDWSWSVEARSVNGRNLEFLIGEEQKYYFVLFLLHLTQCCRHREVGLCDILLHT